MAEPDRTTLATHVARPTLRVLGIRGVPAAHGGFETFAERLAPYLAERGWRVVVYCQEEGEGPIVEDRWCGVERVRMPSGADKPSNTVLFDWRSTRHAARAAATAQKARRAGAIGEGPQVCLTLGYNTALFGAWLRVAGVRNVINMDGIEWRRGKWGAVARTWFWLNEQGGSRLGDELVADHPEIVRHLARSVTDSKITMIPYGADRLAGLPEAPVRALGLEPGRYLTLIARPEPENSVLEAVQGFSRAPRGVVLAVLGHYRDDHGYHRAVRAAASGEVRFLGAIYERGVVQALRQHSLAYVHGHRVGGTNPSLVEALGAGNPVLAHDNAFNRWVAGDAARYFGSAEGFAAALEALLADGSARQAMAAAALRRWEAAFRWDDVLAAYERLLSETAGP